LIQRNIGRWASEWIKSKLKESGLKWLILTKYIHNTKLT
jgi:hypothetical protein